MVLDVAAPTCPKCGRQMELVPWSEWRLGERHTIDAICPNCLYTERLELADALGSLKQRATDEQ